MKFVSIENETRGNIVAQRCGLANNFFTRVKGLLGRNGLDADEGLLIVPCPSIHMFGMRFALDVVFLTADHTVTDFVENIGPGKYYVAKAHHGKPHAALEIAAGEVARLGLERGDKLRCSDPA